MYYESLQLLSCCIVIVLTNWVEHSNIQRHKYNCIKKQQELKRKLNKQQDNNLYIQSSSFYFISFTVNHQPVSENVREMSDHNKQSAKHFYMYHDWVQILFYINSQTGILLLSERKPPPQIQKAVNYLNVLEQLSKITKDTLTYFWISWVRGTCQRDVQSSPTSPSPVVGVFRPTPCRLYRNIMIEEDRFANPQTLTDA